MNVVSSFTFYAYTAIYKESKETRDIDVSPVPISLHREYEEQELQYQWDAHPMKIRYACRAVNGA